MRIHAMFVLTKIVSIFPHQTKNKNKKEKKLTMANATFSTLFNSLLKKK